MGEFTTTHNKCMAQIAPGVAIIDWQLQLLQRIGITEVVIKDLKNKKPDGFSIKPRWSLEHPNDND